MIKLSFVFSLSLLLFGCSLSPIPQQPVKRYTIAPMHYALLKKRVASSATVLVGRIAANPGYDSTKMIYVNVPFRLRAYANNMWVAPPAQLLHLVLVNALREQHFFHAVVSPPFIGATTYSVAVRLLDIQQEFLQPSSNVHLALQVEVMRVQDNRVLAQHVFQIAVPALGNDPYSGVLAINKAAQQLTQQIAKYVVAAARLNKPI